MKIWDEFSGKWRAILITIGISGEALHSKRHVDCIMCGDTNKNARWIAAWERWICSKCGTTPPISMAMWYLGLNFRDTCVYIYKLNGTYKMTDETKDNTKELAQNNARIRIIYQGLRRITPATIAGVYLSRRGISDMPSAGIYYHQGIDYWQDGRKLGTYPAMVAVIRDPLGDVATLQITYLTDDGHKIEEENPVKILPPLRNWKGGGCPIDKLGEKIGIAEGVITALSAKQLDGVAMVAAINSNGMKNFIVPTSVKSIVIYGDSDKTGTGQLAAWTLYHRLHLEGKDVSVVFLGLMAEDLIMSLQTGSTKI